VPKDLADSVQVLRDACKADRPARALTDAEGEVVTDDDGKPIIERDPDWPSRIQAAKALIALPLTGYKRPDDAPAGGPVQVAIVLTSDARAPLHTNGVRLHLSDQNGHGA
jgi:hypothetical protein